LKYRAEIDGLRALAVVPVILFHAGFEVFSGGFVGVDVFFVISGYLITTILIEDLENQRFSLVNFYERRARRILPALFLIILVCIPFAWMWMLPNQMEDFSQSLIAVSLFASNVLFWTESGYFDAAAEDKPLLHTWSLAVEEQYYVLFPIFLFLAWRYGKDRVFWMIVVMASISLLLSEWGWRNKATANFYLAPTRAWELFAGSISAFIVQKQRAQKNNFLAMLGLSAIVFAIFFYDETTPFPSVYALVPVLGVVLLILYADEETLVAKLLSTKMFVGMGLISYSAYLWHQPLFALAKIRLFEPSGSVFVILCITSIALAYLTWRYVEAPFRGRQSLLNSQVSVFTASVIFLASFAVFGIVGHINNGFEASGKSRLALSTLQERISVNHGISSTCEGEFTLSNDCATSATPEVLLWGDSFAMHLYQGINASADTIKLRQITTSSCSPIIGISMLNFSANKGYEWAERCIDFNNQVLRWLKSNESVQFVILSSTFDWIDSENVITEDGKIHNPDIEFVLSKFKKTVQMINNLGVGVVVVSPTPRSGVNIGNCLAKKYQHSTSLDCNFNYSETSYTHDFIKKVSSFSPVYWLYTDICQSEKCFAETNGVFIYRDTGHLSKEGSAFLGRKNNWYDSFKRAALRENSASE
jgi:peptidoglycan/LPS O-acetylase OafA/YrhL